MTSSIEVRCDFETRSDVELKTRGTGPYFASPHWRALILCYRIGTAEIQTWTYDQPCPSDLADAIRGGCTIRAFNASFERQCFEQLHERLGWPLPAIDAYRCTAAEAAAMSLPRALDDVGEALGLKVRKDKRGKALIDLFSKPARAKKGAAPGVRFNEPEDHPEAFAEFVAYCRQDVAAEEAVAARLAPLSDYEQQVYTLDQIINKRGIRIDVTSARAALVLAERAKAKLNAEMNEVTGGFVPTCTNPPRLLEWLRNRGVEIPSAAKAEIVDVLATDDLAPGPRRALELRQEAAKTSVSKLKAMLARADADGRVRGSYLYHGASTGRWTSAGVNFANMPRYRRIFEDAHLDTSVLFKAIRTGSPEHLEFIYGPELGRPMHLLSDAIRGFVWAAPGHDFIQADYSGIEGMVIAWSSGEEWKVRALHEIIANPELPDLYRRTAAAIMNTTTDVVTKKHPYRQAVGKVSELALGFGGGVAAFYSMSKIYGVDLNALYAPVWETADEERRERAVKRYESCVKRGTAHTVELSREAWIACEIIKVGWRLANPAIAAGWKLRETAIRDAIRNPGEITSALCMKYRVANGFLWARLPSGRCLAYGAPKLVEQVWVKINLGAGEWSESETMDRAEAEKGERLGDVKIEGATSPRISVLGVDAKTKKWRRYGLYGGLVAENDTQAIARDVFVNGMLRAEAAGYPIVAHNYDEPIAEVPRGTGDLRAFEKLICELPPWAEGMPLTAGGWRGKRYRKD